MVYKELPDKLKFGLNKMGIAARKLQLGNFLDAIGSFGKVIVDYEEGHDPIELLEEDLPANSIVNVEVKNSDAEATITVPTGILKLYIVRNASSNTLRFTPKGGNYYAVAAGDITVLVEIFAGTFSKLGDTVTDSSLTTFTNKTLTAPTINGGTINEPVIKKAKHDGNSFVTHNFGEETTWTMTAAEAQNDIIMVGNTNADSTIILPDTTTDTKQFTVFNSYSSYAVTVKGEGEDVGITIAAGKSAIIFEIQNHVYRITADA